MIDFNTEHNHGILGAVLSIMCTILSILPTILNWSENIDRALIPFMHLTQFIAAILAILIGLPILKKNIVEWMKK